MICTRWTGALVGVVLLLTATAQAADKDAIARGRQYLETNERASSVLFFIHPTPTLQKWDYRGQGDVVDGRRNVVRGHFCLHYRYTWKGGLLGDDGHTDVTFLFDDKGRFYEIQMPHTSSSVKPFAGAGLVIELLKQAILDEIDKGNDETAKKAVRKLISEVNAKGLLEFLLTMEQK